MYRFPVPSHCTDEEDGDTKAFLLNRNVTIKDGVSAEEEYRICEFLGRFVNIIMNCTLLISFHGNLGFV